MKLLLLLVILVVVADAGRRRKKKKKPSPFPKCATPTKRDCLCWFDLNRNDCPCCVEDYCIQTMDPRTCVHKELYQKYYRKPYISETPKRKFDWCYGHDYWCGNVKYPRCVYQGGKGCGRRNKRIYYKDLIEEGIVSCSAHATFRKPVGEKRERCVCNSGYIGNGLQCIAEGEDEFIEVVEKPDPSQMVKISFEIESNSTMETVSAMEALTSNCYAASCDLDETRS